MKLLLNSKISLFIFLLFVSNKSFARVDVEYGGNDDLDACLSVGHVANLSSGPDGFLAVKEAPDLKAVRADKIYNKQIVWICASSKDNKWLGIVYSKDKKQECGTSTSVEKRQPYPGPCKSGWVSAKWIVVDAG